MIRQALGKEVYLCHGPTRIYVAQVLIDHGADVNSRESLSRSTALMWARSPEVSQLLIDKGAKLFLRDTFGRTAKKRAKEYGDKKIVQLLKDASRKQRQEIGTFRWLSKKVRNL